MAIDKGRSYVASTFFLKLDGVAAGFLSSVEGGGVTADVIRVQGPDYFLKKQLGKPKPEEFSIQIGLSLANQIYDWIDASWRKNSIRKNGSILTCDYNNKVKAEREFSHALITEVIVPALDAASRDPGYLTVKFQPEHTQFKKGSGEQLKAPSEPVEGSGQKAWLPSSFRLEISGLDCTTVSKVDSFKVIQKVASEAVGETRDSLKELGILDFPNLKISLSEASAQTWFDWHEDFVIKGNNGENQEKKGSLIFLSANSKEELLRIDFSGLGIFKLTMDQRRAGTEEIQRVTAELYCEKMEFAHSKSKV